MAAFVEGTLINTGLFNSVFNIKNDVTTLENILTIQNKATFSGLPNAKFVQPIQVSFSNTGGSGTNCVYRLILNPTLGGILSYTDISTNTSVVSYNTAGTTITGGRILAVFFVGRNLSDRIDISNLNIILNPTDILTIGGTSLDEDAGMRCSIMWNEQF